MSGRRPIPAVAYLGTLLGTCGWALGLAFAALAAGRPQVVWEVALPGVLVSLALGLVTLLAWTGMHQHFGPRAATTKLTLVGGLVTILGVLLLLIHVWVEPVLARDPGLQQVLAATGSATRVPFPIVWSVLGLGAGLLALVLVRARRPPA